MQTQSKDRVFYVLESKAIKYIISDADEETSEDMINNLIIIHDDIIGPSLRKVSPSISVLEASEDMELAAAMEQTLATDLPLHLSMDDVLDMVEEMTVEYNEDDLLN